MLTYAKIRKKRLFVNAASRDETYPFFVMTLGVCTCVYVYEFTYVLIDSIENGTLCIVHSIIAMIVPRVCVCQCREGRDLLAVLWTRAYILECQQKTSRPFVR